MKFKPVSVDEYILQFDDFRQGILQKVRETIVKSASEAQEVISYQMPAYKLNGDLVFFAIYEKHLGLYPSGSALEIFKEELNIYKTSKGAIQFQLKEEVPYDLIARIVQYRVQENKEKSLAKKAHI